MLNVACRHRPCECGNPCLYRCPRCSESLCSLQCSKDHKNKCKKTNKNFDFIPLSKMSVNTIVQDYRFLERIAIKAESATRSNLIQLQNMKTSKALTRACAIRGVKLKFLPKFFKRSKENTTRVERNIIFWKILWKINKDSRTIEINDRVSENIKIEEALERAFVKGDLEILKNCSVFLICYKINENNEFNEVENFKCDFDSTLHDILKDKCIIEHPCFLVYFEDDK